MTSLSLLSAKLKVLSPLQRQMLLSLAGLALHPQDNLPGSLGLLVKDGLGLSTETHLFGVVPTLSLGEVGGFSGLVLGYLVDLVLTAFLAGAVGFAFFGDVDHLD